jgi:hypothetical protein
LTVPISTPSAVMSDVFADRLWASAAFVVMMPTTSADPVAMPINAFFMAFLRRM